MNYFIKLIFCICLFFAVTANAQNRDLYNVRLKSGLVIKCELLKVVMDSFVIIRQYGQVNTIKYNDISSVDFSETTVSELTQFQQPDKAKTNPFRKNLPDPGLSVGLQTGACFGIGDFGGPTLSILLKLSVLKGINKRCQAGVAFALDPYLLNYDMIIGSVLGEGRYYFIKEKPSSPFLHGQAGYGFNLLSNKPAQEGGFTYVLGLGQSFRNRNQDIFSIMLGYRSQATTQEVPVNNSLRIYHRVITRMEVKVEFRF